MSWNTSRRPWRLRKGCGEQRADAALAMEADVRKEGECCIVQQRGSAVVYEALLTHSESLERVQAMRSRIEHLGGALSIERVGGAILVTLTLPAPYTPEQFYPSLPFFAV